MIIYDLNCKEGHKFEGWFKDRSAFEDQRSQNLITCPVCGNSDVKMVPSAMSIMAKDTKTAVGENAEELSLPRARKLFHEYINKNFDDVGKNFADIALKMHHGEQEKRNIKGTTTGSEEDVLKEEGVQFFKIPIPKFDS